MLIVIILESVLFAAFLWLAVQLTLYLYNRKRHEQFFATQARLDSAAQATVKEVQQVLAEDEKLKRVDQKLKRETVKEYHATSMKIMLANLGPRGLREIRKALGLPRRAPLDRFLTGHIEAAVYDLKAWPRLPAEIPSEPGGRFYPNTLRIPRVEKPTEHPDENLFDEKTHITGR